MTNRTQWTPALIDALRALYPDQTAANVSHALGMSAGAIYQKAYALGLRKSEAFKTSAQSGRIARGRTDPRMVATQIKPGATPWNKGLPGSTGLHPNSRSTQFRKGEMQGAAQHNYVPIGTLRLTKDGYLERKVTDDTSIYPARRWIALHRLVWEAARGPIPPGHIVVFRIGQKTVIEAELTIDRLECISRGEHAKRNHPRSKSPELGRLIQLKGAITRQVNRRIKESQQ